MKQKFLATALTLAMTVGAVGPALADGAASTRNIILGGAAAGVLITNYNHKKRIKQAEMREQAKRMNSYKAWFYRKYGYYPTQAQIDRWYVRTYGVQPSK